MLLPDAVGSAAHPHLMVGGGKEGIIFLVDRDNMGISLRQRQSNCAGSARSHQRALFQHAGLFQ